MKRRTFMIGTGAAATAAAFGCRWHWPSASPTSSSGPTIFPAASTRTVFDVPMQGYMVNVYDPLYAIRTTRRSSCPGSRQATRSARTA